MNSHDEIQDLLEGYVDETLDRATRRAVDDHLADCAECRAILDEVAPVDLSGLAGGAVDERSLRRSVRRAMWRTVTNTALMLVSLWIVAWLVSAVIIQPLVINRGDRATIAARATFDMAMMVNEGAIATDWDVTSGAASRTNTAHLVLQVGAGAKELGEVGSRIGITRFGAPLGGWFWPYVTDFNSGTPGEYRLAELGSGTVATVAAHFNEPISLARAQELADSTDYDVRVVWAGFPTSQRLDLDEQPFSGFGYGVLGYPTCLEPGMVDDSRFGGTSVSGGLGLGGAPASIANALAEVRRAVGTLTANPWLIERAVDPETSDVERLEQTAVQLAQADPGVVTLVVTGPTAELIGFLDDVEVEYPAVLAVDFYNWSDFVCGR
ncbi:MAG: zf-HC2 domain-containing protein [Acidimicrobiia bacterium]|nr:zf-HC2 domain-containing protein [Acidimicrobiia bacterium]